MDGGAQAPQGWAEGACFGKGGVQGDNSEVGAKPRGAEIMSGKTVNSAILLLVIGNAMALISDVFIKLLEPGAPVFQFAFLRCLITLGLLLPMAGQLDRCRQIRKFRSCPSVV